MAPRCLDDRKPPSFGSLRAPDGIRTHTGAGLSRLPLPLGYGSLESLASAESGYPDPGRRLLIGNRIEPELAIERDAGGVVAAGDGLDRRGTYPIQDDPDQRRGHTASPSSWIHHHPIDLDDGTGSPGDGAK